MGKKKPITIFLLCLGSAQSLTVPLGRRNCVCPQPEMGLFSEQKGHVLQGLALGAVLPGPGVGAAGGGEGLS